MSILDNIVVTEIEKPIIVFSAKGRALRMEDRPSYGLSFCNSGQITYTHNGKQFVSTPRTAVLLPQGADYSLYGDKQGVFPVINFRCDGMLCDTITLFELNDPQKHLENFKKLSDLFLFQDKRLDVFSLFYDMLGQISSDQAVVQNPLRPLLDYIEGHIHNPELNNTALAEKMGVSEVYLRRLFAAHCGTTPKQYILNLRMEKAKQLLSDNLYTITEIAEKCGFSNLYHFCRVFKQRTGTTPSDYADRHMMHKI